MLHLIAPQPSPAGPEQVGDSYRLFLIPILSCASVGALCLCFRPCLSLRPPIAPVPLPTIRPASSIAETTTIIPYRAVLCCAFCSGLLCPSNCIHLQRNTRASTPRHVNSAVPVSLLQGCSQQHHAARHHAAPQYCHVKCPLAKPSASVSPATRHRAPQLACHNHLGRQQSPRSDGPACPAQPTSGFS